MSEQVVELAGPGFPSDLIVRALAVSDRLGVPSVARVTFTVPSAALDELAALNKPVQLRVTLEGSESLVVFGRVVDIEYAGFADGDHLYHMGVRSTLSKLDGGRRYRIFQAKSATDIIKQVLNNAGIDDLDLVLREPCTSREYCVQFGESDLAFVHRLCEHEGLFYAVFSAGEAETVVFADSLDGLTSQANVEQIEFVPRESSEPLRRNEISEWMLSRRAVPAGVEAKGYEFRTPRRDFAAQSEVANAAHGGLAAETLLPARYANQGNGERYVSARAEALATSSSLYRARCGSLTLRAGRRFALSRHPRDVLNQEYVAIASETIIESAAGRSAAGGEWRVSHSIDVVLASEPFRLPLVTPLPLVAGPQIARVVGKSGEDVFTDEHGRVKVKFRWDPADNEDENSSCWLRVMQPWAGPARGVSVVPRIGDEVVVGFADGNPDHPFVLGGLYNGEAKAAADLPSVATDYVIRTRSSKQGGADNYNELRLSDAKGRELVSLQAEKDYSALVKNDSSADIKNNRTDRIGREYRIEAGDLLEITVGQSSLRMDSAGNISLRGVAIKIEGRSSVEIKGMSVKAVADVDATFKGTQTKVQGVMLDLTADGIASLKAALTKIG
jgi:type VI secretion system secreted protein VgrG